MKKSIHLVSFFREIAIVVIGVLIAVSVGNYKERKDNEKYIKQTLLAIENEIRLSNNEVDTVLKKHLKLFEILEEQIDKGEQTLLASYSDFLALEENKKYLEEGTE